MNKENEIKFIRLMKKRINLSNQNTKNIVKCLKNDTQLIDMLNNFNEANDYKKTIKG